MVNYECNICAKNFNHKGNYEKHLKCAKPCKKTQPCSTQTQPFSTQTQQIKPNPTKEYNDMQCCFCFFIKTFTSFFMAYSTIFIYK